MNKSLLHTSASLRPCGYTAEMTNQASVRALVPLLEPSVSARHVRRVTANRTTPTRSP